MMETEIVMHAENKAPDDRRGEEAEQERIHSATPEPAAEVVAKVEDAGGTLSANSVSAVRNKAKAPKESKGKPTSKSKGKLRRKTKGKPTPKPKGKLRRKPKGRGGPRQKAKPGPKSKNGMSASDFIRSQPATAKAKDVVAAANAKGIKVSSGLVYMVRSTAKKRAERASVKRKQGRKPRAVVDGEMAYISTFKKLALDLGIARAKQVLDELERRLAELIAG